MKQIILNIQSILVLLFLTIWAPLFAQSESTGSTDEKIKVRINLSYTQDFNGNKFIDAKVSYRVNRKIVFCANENIDLFVNQTNEKNKIASGKTDESGKIHFPLTGKFTSIADTSLGYNFIATLPNSKNFFSKNSSLKIQEAYLEIELYEKDSTSYVKAQITSKTDSTPTFITDEELKFYVQRTFSKLPFGGDYLYSDEEGVVIVEFPKDFPGDEEGGVEIVVQLLEHEEYGTIERRGKSNWGVPKVVDNSMLNHQLWSSHTNAPVQLIIISLVIIGGIWGILGFLVLRLVKISKLGKQNQLVK